MPNSLGNHFILSKAHFSPLVLYLYLLSYNNFVLQKLKWMLAKTVNYEYLKCLIKLWSETIFKAPFGNSGKSGQKKVWEDKEEKEKEGEINVPASIFQNSLPTLMKIYVLPFSYVIIIKINISDICCIAMRES